VSDPLIPTTTKRAAERAFIRTTAQAYAATLGGGVTVTTILAIITGQIDPLTVGVTAGVALVSPLIAGVAAYASILGQGVPEEYAAPGATEGRFSG